jgi:hypothetical protein
MQIDGETMVTRRSKGLVEFVKDIIMEYVTDKGFDMHKGTHLVVKTVDGKDVLELPIEFTRSKKKKLMNKQVEYMYTMGKKPYGEDNEYKVENEYNLWIYDVDGKLESWEYGHVNYITK